MPNQTEIIAAIPEYGIEIENLIELFGWRIRGRMTEFLMLVESFSILTDGSTIKLRTDPTFENIDYRPYDHPLPQGFATTKEIENAIPYTGMRFMMLLRQFFPRPDGRIGALYALVESIAIMDDDCIVTNKEDSRFPTLGEFKAAMPQTGTTSIWKLIDIFRARSDERRSQFIKLIEEVTVLDPKTPGYLRSR